METLQNVEFKARRDFDAKRLSVVEFENILKAGAGKASMDEFRKVIAESIDMENKLNEEREARSDAAADATFMWITFGLGFADHIGRPFYSRGFNEFRWFEP